MHHVSHAGCVLGQVQGDDKRTNGSFWESNLRHRHKVSDGNFFVQGEEDLTLTNSACACLRGVGPIKLIFPHQLQNGKLEQITSFFSWAFGVVSSWIRPWMHHWWESSPGDVSGTHPARGSKSIFRPVPLFLFIDVRLPHAQHTSLRHTGCVTHNHTR